MKILKSIVGLILLLALGFCAAPAEAWEVPFSTIKTVSGSFAGADSVFVADVDGDGDMDILGAAYSANQIYDFLKPKITNLPPGQQSFREPSGQGDR